MRRRLAQERAAAAACTHVEGCSVAGACDPARFVPCIDIGRAHVVRLPGQVLVCLRYMFRSAFDAGCFAPAQHYRVGLELMQAALEPDEFRMTGLHPRDLRNQRAQCVGILNRLRMFRFRDQHAGDPLFAGNGIGVSGLQLQHFLVAVRGART